MGFSDGLFSFHLAVSCSVCVLGPVLCGVSTIGPKVVWPWWCGLADSLSPSRSFGVLSD